MMPDPLVKWYQAIAAQGAGFVLEELDWDEPMMQPKKLVWRNQSGQQFRALWFSGTLKSGSLCHGYRVFLYPDTPVGTIKLNDTMYDNVVAHG